MKMNMMMKSIRKMKMNTMRKKIILGHLQKNWNKKVFILPLKIIETIKFAKDASNGLSCEKMQYHLDKTHPRVSTKDKKSNIVY